MNYLEKVIPQSLILCNTFMAIVGKYTESNIGLPPHLDEGDRISYIITLGSPNNGGDTDYYAGLKNNTFGVKQILIPLKYCQLQIGCYNNIYHGIRSWYGNRITLNLFIDHLQLCGMKYYKKYQLEGFPRFFIYNK